MKGIEDIIHFIRKLYPNQKVIPLHVPTFSGNEKKYLNECIDSTFVSSVGQFVDQFEIEFAKYTGSDYAIVCVNGTNAIHLCLQLAGVKPHHEVITQALTFIATPNAITYSGAKPIFIDVDKDTFGLSPKALESFLQREASIKNGKCFNKKSGKQIKACLPMHTFGHACRINEIKEICENYHITLVEDAAEAVGSFYNNRHLGLTGKLAAVSFNGNKVITTGGGGMILTNDKDLAEKAKHLTTQAKIDHQWEYTHDQIGYNYRMPNINAALGLAQLEQLNEFLANKRAIAKEYREFFNEMNIEFFTERMNEESNYWINAIILDSRKQRDQFLKKTNQAGILTRPIWTLMTRMPMYESCQKDALTNSKWLEDRVVNLPSSVSSTVQEA